MEIGILPTAVWVLLVVGLVILSWFVFYFSPVVVKTTLSFVLFSLIVFAISVWVGTYTISNFVKDWSRYEISRIKEGAFTFIERKKSEHRVILKRFVDEPEKIIEDKFIRTIFDYVALADKNKNIIFSNKEIGFSIKEDFEQKFYKTKDGIYLITVNPAKDNLIVVGEKADIRILPALQDMLSVRDAFFQDEKEKTDPKNAEIDLGNGIKLVIVPNYDFIFELLSKLVSGTSRGIGGAMIFAVVFFAILSILYIRRPIVGLLAAAREVEKGNFEYEIQDRPKGDIGLLVRTFNEMVRGLRKRDAQIKYRNELLSSIKELARAILGEFEKEKIFELCVDTAALKTGSKCAVFYGDKLKFSEPLDIDKEDIQNIGDGEVVRKNGLYLISYEIAAYKEEGKIVYGKFVAQRDRDYIQEEKEFFVSIVNYAASACLRGDYVKKLRLLQSTDSITGLFNSTFFKSSIKREISMLQRFQRNFAVVFIDIKNSEEIIDKFGNIIWEDILKAIAAVMKKSVRTYDIPARLGNDKFALLLPNTTSENAKVVEKRVKEIISSAPEIPSLPEVEIKIDIFSTATDSESPDSILQKVDERVSALQEKI